MAHSFKFAVIRLSPDSLRGEAINLGVAIFRDGYLETHTGQVLTRARAIVPDFSNEMLETSVALLKKFGAINLPDNEKHQALGQIGMIRLSDLGSFESRDVDGPDYASNITFLLSSLVNEPRASRGIEAISRPRFVTDVRTAFRNENLLASENDQSAILDHKIVPNWKPPQRPNLTLDLALKNREMRVCEIVELDLEGEKEVSSNFQASAFKLKAAEDFIGATDRVLAYKGHGPTKRVKEALELVDPYATLILDWDDIAKRNSFVQRWIDAASSR
jgi:Protein of unknown function (DUF3037)